MTLRDAIRWLLILLLAGGIFSGCGGGGPRIGIGSKSFPESRLLGEMLAQTLTAQEPELTIDRRLGLGGTRVAFRALTEGSIDVYPEYTGTVLLAILEESVPSDRDAILPHIRDELAARHDLGFLAPFGYDNSYVIAVSENAAGRFGLETISDLAPHAGELRAAFTHEFLGRADGVPGLQEHYGFELENARGVEHLLAYRAVENGEADLFDAYATDGKLANAKLVLLEDDRQFFPPYEAGWLVRKDVAERYPAVDRAMRAFEGRIDADQMRRWNFEVEVEGREVEDVAREALTDLGMPVPSTRATGSGSRILALTFEHLWLTGLSVLAAVLVALPAGILLSRRPRISETVLGAVGIIQTIPSIALLAVLIPLFGLGAQPALVALFLYGLLPILRNTTVGIRDIDPVLLEAGTAMGMTGSERLRILELPLALPVIFAGIRTAAIINIGTATLAAFVGAGGLGELIKAGIDLNSDRMILEGAIPAALLAAVADWTLGRLERKMSPG
ncbi:MAG: glycine betaine ABC transporter substrate-binding protein [Planctomycetota bacterium]